ncbi:hypothetical protein [Pseudactinotalea sp. HY158]|uniref:hypothetical protein n=1 Tax=Pseudactinotalea sp. HY158 TaxID=2654547 RepID=UPI00129C373C|nr:hypothetical protein [Pseudactinotalea sp. HY158]QGH69786.1 hypothetical protein GCE65_09880 [Pseudactinotalea sp. HY158]
MANRAEGFNSALIAAFADVSEQIDEWEAVALTVEGTIEHLDGEAASIGGTIMNAIWEIDGDLAETDHVRVCDSVDIIEEALRKAGAVLIRKSVASELADVATDGDVLGVGAEDIGEALLSISTFETAKVDLIDSCPEGGVDGDLIDAIEAAERTAVEMVRAASDDIRKTWEDAHIASDQCDLYRLLVKLGELEVAGRRLRAAYDEWYALLGGLSNVAPERIGGVDGAILEGLSSLCTTRSDRG